MKILIDSYKLLDNNYNLMRTLINNLQNDKNCEITLLCSSKDEKNKLTENFIFDGYKFKLFDEDLGEYDFYLSAMNDKPDCISKFSNITSVAILLDLFYRFESLDESFATIRENTRFYRNYDYYLTPFNYPENIHNITDDLEIRNLIYLNLYNFSDNYTIEKELEFRKSVCTNAFSSLILEKMTEINNLRSNEPLVSVVTITFNLIKNGRKETIVECMDSVKVQDYKNIEHIIVDGNSTDGTMELIKKYDSINRLRVYSEPDDGHYDAMNKGINHARGKYIVFLNSDDFYCRNNAISDAVSLLEKNKLDYLFGTAKAITVEGKVVLWHPDINSIPYAMNYCHQTLFVKTEVMKKLGGFNLAYKVSSDSDMMIKLYKDNYKYGVLLDPYITYRLGGLSSVQSEQSKLDHSNSFYKQIGSEIGLTRKECEELWAMKFFKTYDIRHKLYMIRKLSKKFNTETVLIKIIENENYDLSLKQSVKRILQICARKIKIKI
mgnify:CR=1 FL=1